MVARRPAPSSQSDRDLSEQAAARNASPKKSISRTKATWDSISSPLQDEPARR
eukprot:CAMPEP_0119370726 /NCGR_PEP_ID=MMETSP1334-20130426/17046_1 /TAXON_ID=127549 /ORGANISM="Calcidiscus leptoporus, Strain RCC1130" /LENGTH=52 /DNA_ID=CAMNT_0007387847 /DNA_START=212 /DNA_END=367 /DNA_ORIENTATION=-